MIAFDFHCPTRVVFGRGAVRELAALARAFGHRVLVVTGSAPERHRSVWEHLTAGGATPTVITVAGEPTLDAVERAREQARKAGADWVLGVGGGAAMDTAKAVAGLLGENGPAIDFLEVVGGGRPLGGPARPLAVVPTTAGSGAEVTRNAVLTSTAHRVKASLRSPHLYPRVAVIDPELACGLPAGPTAASGLDAITQLIEPYVSRRAQPMTDALCLEGLRRAGRAFPRVLADPGDVEAREGMAFAALVSGIALANAGLGAVHGLAGVVGAVAEAPHGAVCAALLRGVIRANRATAAASGGGSLEARYAEAAAALTGDRAATADTLETWVGEWTARGGVPGLRALGLDPGAARAVAAQSIRASSMRTNPVELSEAVLVRVLEEAG